MWTCISVYITWHFATFALEIYTYSMTYQLNSVNNACLMELWAKTGLYTFLWKSCISIRISSLYIISPFDNCYSGSMIWRSWQTHDIFCSIFLASIWPDLCSKKSCEDTKSNPLGDPSWLEDCSRSSLGRWWYNGGGALAGGWTVAQQYLGGFLYC